MTTVMGRLRHEPVPHDTCQMLTLSLSPSEPHARSIHTDAIHKYVSNKRHWCGGGC